MGAINLIYKQEQNHPGCLCTYFSFTPKSVCQIEGRRGTEEQNSNAMLKFYTLTLIHPNHSLVRISYKIGIFTFKLFEGFNILFFIQYHMKISLIVNTAVNIPETFFFFFDTQTFILSLSLMALVSVLSSGRAWLRHGSSGSTEPVWRSGYKAGSQTVTIIWV